MSLNGETELKVHCLTEESVLLEARLKEATRSCETRNEKVDEFRRERNRLSTELKATEAVAAEMERRNVFSRNRAAVLLYYGVLSMHTGLLNRDVVRLPSSQP